MCVRSCACVCQLADAGVRAGMRVRVRMCLLVRVTERTRACVGAHACALEGTCSRGAGVRACGCADVRMCGRVGVRACGRACGVRACMDE